jgi:hypothetical protein
MAKGMHESTLLQAIHGAIDSYFDDGNSYRGFIIGSEMTPSGILFIKLWEEGPFLASGCDVGLSPDHEFTVEVRRIR